MNVPHKTLEGTPLVGEEPVEFPSGEATLKGRLWRPEGRPRAAVVLHGATGVPHRYYRHFAAWLAAEGYAVLSYDYRDFGASAAGHVRTSRAGMVDWGLHDQAAAQVAIERLVPDAPLWVIGHSLGGFMLPFQPGAARVKRLIAVASGPTHLSDTVWREWPFVALFWSPPVLWLTKAVGYLPGRLFGRPDLPARVYSEWRRWCTTRGFYLGDVGKALPVPDWGAMRGEAKFVAVADDPWIPPPVVWRLMQHYPEAVKRQLVLKPAEHGLKKIGHIGVFAEKNRALWPAILA